MDISLKGRNALVCGGSQGIGKATALLLAEMGASVTIVSRSEDTMKAIVDKLNTKENQHHGYLVADFNDVSELKKTLQSHLKNHTYQILINNTGGPSPGPIIEAKIDDFRKAFNQHLICNHTISLLLIPQMREANYGRIINIISTSVKAPLDGLGVSNTTRGAVASWAKTMSNELGIDEITVNNVLPGFTSTGRLDELFDDISTKQKKSKQEIISHFESTVPMKRFAAPVEVANAIGFLASPAASYITGINLPVDGGRTKSL